MQFPRDQADEEIALGVGGPAEELSQHAPARCLCPRAGHRAHLGEHAVYLADGESGRHPARRAASRGQSPEGRVAHADLPLAQLTGEKGDRDRDLRRAGRAEQIGDLSDLDATPWRGCDGLRCEHEFGQQHNRIVPDRPDRPGLPAGRTRRIGQEEDVVTDQPLTPWRTRSSRPTC